MRSATPASPRCRASSAPYARAAALAKARCELDLAANPPGNCTSTGGSVNMDGTTVTMLFRYPAATTTGITAASSIVAASDGLIINGSNPISFTAVGANTPANCLITYTGAAGRHGIHRHHRHLGLLKADRMRGAQPFAAK